MGRKHNYDIMPYNESLAITISGNISKDYPHDIPIPSSSYLREQEVRAFREKYGKEAEDVLGYCAKSPPIRKGKVTVTKNA